MTAPTIPTIGKWIAGAAAGIVFGGVLLLGGLLIFGTAPQPAEVKSVSDPMRRVDFSDLPKPLAFNARDGQVLHYRLYPGTGDEIVVLIHGSSGESSGMHAVAKALRAAGDTVYVPDLRGHGYDGRPGDLNYIGQLEDDLADLVSVVRQSHPHAPIVLAGHSSGGGFVLRVAGEPEAHLFARFVAVSPLLPYGAATYRPDVGGWATPFVGRIVALKILNRFGVRAFNALPVVAFGIDRHAPVPLVAAYSYRMQTNFSAPRDALERLSAATQPFVVLIGAQDEIFYADRYAQLIHDARPDVPVVLIPRVNHMGMVVEPAGLAAIAAATTKQESFPAATLGSGPRKVTVHVATSVLILQRTPVWVWAVLLVLLVTGVQAMRPRVLPVWRLFIVPAVFIAWGIESIVQRALVQPALAFAWLAAAAAGIALGWLTVHLGAFAFEAQGRIVRVPGTPMPLLRNAAIFVARYALAVAAAFTAGSAAHVQVVVLDVAVSGLATGYFLGWLVRFRQARRAGAAPGAAAPVLGT